MIKIGISKVVLKIHLIILLYEIIFFIKYHLNLYGYFILYNS